MFQNTFELLQLLVNPTDGVEGSAPRLHSLDDQFVDKFTEFLGSFVKSHLRRFESNAQFPILAFLNILFKYTFEQQRTESYLACLDVWNICVEYVQGLISSRVPEAEVIVPKYRGFLLLVSEVLKQLQFRAVHEKLEELDDEDFDDDQDDNDQFEDDEQMADGETPRARELQARLKEIMAQLEEAKENSKDAGATAEKLQKLKAAMPPSTRLRAKVNCP